MNKDNKNTNAIILFFLGVALLVFVVSSAWTKSVSKPIKNTRNFVADNALRVAEGVAGETKSFFGVEVPNASSTSATTTNIATTTALEITTPKKVSKSTGTYLEVKDGCGPYFGGACLSVRNGPGSQYDKLYKLRSGTVLKVVGSVTTPNIVTTTVVGTSTTGSTTETVIKKTEGSTTWYKIAFDEWIRYPERLNTKNWYVSSDFVRTVKANREISSGPGVPPVSTKKIVVDRGEQMLYAYEDKVLYMKVAVSTGKQGTLTPRGTFTIFSKVPSRYMQGPLPGISDQAYDLPGVPWTMYFTEQGGAIHGAYWHDKFGQEWSHGCVNLPTDTAEKLYGWADIGTVVVVRD